MNSSERQSVNATILDDRPIIVQSGAEWVVLDQSPINGKVFLFATDPHNAGRLYASGMGVFRSDDFGETWLPLNQDLRPTILVTDPSTPGRLYAVSDGSVWASSDAGATWRRIAGPLNSVMSFLVDAAGTLYAVGVEGTFKSTSSGDSWSPVSSVAFLLAADPLIPGVLYGWKCPSFCAIFKTSDGASNWIGPIFTPGVAEELVSFTISSTAPTTVYLVTVFQELSACFGRVFASQDGGGTWEAIFGRSYVGPIASDPVRPGVLYAGARGCGSSPDLGGVFRVSPAGQSSLLGEEGFVVSKLAVAPDGSVLYGIADFQKFAILRLSSPRPATIPFR